MRVRLPLPKGVPRTLRFESVTFKVSVLADGRLCFWYYDGRRVPVRRRTLDELKDEAERVATSILNADTAAKGMTAERTRIATSAFATLDPLGIQLDAAARDFVEAARIAPGVPVPELARFYAARPQDRRSIPATAAVLKELLEQLREDGRDAKYVDALENDLEPFAARHADLRQVEEKEVRTWLKEHRARTGATVSQRRRDNLRDAVVRLLNFAVDQKHLTSEQADSALSVGRISQPGEVSTFSHREVGVLLQHVSARWFPWLILAAFAGLRTSEIFRLSWSAFNWDDDEEDLADEPHQPVISVPRKVAKKVRISRVVPIGKNLEALLSAYRSKVGNLFPHKSWRSLEDEHQDELNRLERVTGLEWKNNVLRHSFGSHRLAIVKNVNTVVYEMGNSPQMVRESYNNPKSEKEARRYFALSLPDYTNVLPLEFATKRTA